MARRVKVFFDGGCRPNPGPMEVAVVTGGRAHVFDDLGQGTNGDAEWLALIRAVEICRQSGLEHVELIGDALWVVRQANQVMTTRTAMHAHAAAFLALVTEMPPVRVRWIKRQQNLAGIALASRHPR
ncbi:ribonuclease HI [Novosphingobium nitrogenifigens]|nr:reverse transcriptase-like protein [Novosphingobium nitrogenifigens]